MTSRCSSNNCIFYRYDEGANGKGQLTQVDDATGYAAYTYNSSGDLLTQTNNILGNVFVTSRSYDTSGRLAKLTYPTQAPAQSTAISFGYDNRGRILSISHNDIGVASLFQYQPATSRPWSWSLFASKAIRAVTLDESFRKTKLETPSSHSISLNYQRDSTISSIVDNIFPANSSHLEYDELKRVTRVTRPSYNETLMWDVVGNLKERTENTDEYIYDTAVNNNWLTKFRRNTFTIDFAYDARGNTVSATQPNGPLSYSYDSFGRMTGVARAGVQLGTYKYNAFDQRVMKETSGGITFYIYGPSGELLGEIAQNRTAYVWLNGELFGISRANQFYASLNDQVGRPEALINSNNTVVWRARNLAFGRPGTVTDSIGGLNAGFPGQYWDSESELWYNWHRYYDPQLRRYLQSDPLGMTAGINTYSFVSGNPLSRIDFDGRQDINFVYGRDTPPPQWFRDWNDTDHSRLEYVAGRYGHPVIFPAGPVSRFIEHVVPAGRSFAVIHDATVERMRREGYSDRVANIPTMPAAYRQAVRQEGGRSVRLLENNLLRMLDRANCGK
jgi:RHS repeat-associated protein